MSEIETIDPERLLLPSASAFERVVLCPGSVRLCATLKSIPADAEDASDGQPDSKDDELAASGTRIHRAAETGNTLELDADEAEIYRQGIKHEEAIVEKWMADKNLDECEEGPREMRVWLHDPLNFPELLGSVKLDRHYYNKAKGCLLSVDWKTGFNPNLPPSPRSWQLRFGVVALWREEYDWMKEARVAHCKAQAKCTTQDYCDYNEADLRHSWDSIQFHLWESAQPDAQLRPGVHCRWCPAKAHCPQSAAFAMVPAVMTSNLPRGTQLDPVLAVSTLAPQALVKLWENSNVI
ncbi:MAG TPA: PD-(D/E)XK nuclease family protein, partial [Hyphomicrobiaceae bacterium]|nr:PD-(D/E)XK nuclease family protein [Hyphomicrobiaceae bacterium]